jgi:hypothetical protein
MSCGSAPEALVEAPAAEPVQTYQPVLPPEPVAEAIPPEEEVFNPLLISEDRFTATKAELQALIEDLNRIIRARNYSQWIGFLSESYFQNINSPAFLESRTDDLYRRDQMIASNSGRPVQRRILRTARDYFDYVVVPSRQNDHVDDIAFVTTNRVKAYTEDSRGNKLVLYDLEIIDGRWKIIN